MNLEPSHEPLIAMGTGAALDPTAPMTVAEVAGQRVGHDREARGSEADRIGASSVTLSSAAPAVASGGERRPLGAVRAFSYVASTEKASTYRAIMSAFREAHDRAYVVTLSPDELIARLDASPFLYDLDPDGTLDPSLDYLEGQGLLRRMADTAPARTRVEFLRRRSLYQITEIGLVVERAVSEVESALGRTGSLQRVALGAIEEALDELVRIARAPESEADRARAAALLAALDGQFGSLTSNAGLFLANLDRLTRAGEIDRTAFLTAKGAIADYVSDFITDLRTAAPRIAARLASLDAVEVEVLMLSAANATESSVSLAGDNPVVARSAELMTQWDNLRAWFAGDHPTSQTLEAAARTAVASLVAVFVRMTEAMSGRVSRGADFLRLAQWFAASEPREAHVLFRGAFGLAPARHFTRGAEDEETVSPRTSWLDAPPVFIPPRLRVTGTNASAGRIGPIQDTRATQALIAAERRAEAERRAHAARRLAGKGPVRLSALGVLDAAEFELVIEILGRALSAEPGEERLCRTDDGTLLVTVSDPPAGTPPALVTVPGGRFRSADYVLEAVAYAASAVELSA